MQQSEFIDICYTCEMTEYYLLSISSNQNSKHLYVIKRSWTLLIYVSFGRQLSELSKNMLICVLRYSKSLMMLLNAFMLTSIF